MVWIGGDGSTRHYLPAGTGEGSETLAQLADRFDLHAHQIAQWRAQLVARAAEVFAAVEGDPRGTAPPIDLKALHAKIGQQALDLDFLAGALGTRPDRSARR